MEYVQEPFIEPSVMVSPEARVYDTFAKGLDAALQAVNELCNVPIPAGIKLDDVEPLVDIRKSLRRTIGNRSEHCHHMAQTYERNGK